MCLVEGDGNRRKFTDEFKRESVKLATQPGVPLTKVAADLGVERTLLLQMQG
jgi:transposase-like protein